LWCVTRGKRKKVEKEERQTKETAFGKKFQGMGGLPQSVLNYEEIKKRAFRKGHLVTWERDQAWKFGKGKRGSPRGKIATRFHTKP